MRLLLVDSDVKARTAVRRAFEDLGYFVEEAATKGEAASVLTVGPFDAVMLDADLVDGEGLVLLTHMRRQGDPTPVLVTRRDASPWDRAEGLNAGADDYVGKPALLEEVVARVQALLRRPRQFRGPSLRLGDLALNSVERQAYADGTPLRLTKLQFRMLEALLRRHPSVVPLEVLKSDMYGHAAVRTNNVERHLVGLRRQLSTHRSAVRIISVTGGGRGLAIEEAPAERRALFRPPSGADFRSPPAQARRARNPT